MGCIQVKKLNDNEIVKSNYIENQNNNCNNIIESNVNKKEDNIILKNNILNNKQETNTEKQITKKTNNKTLNETKQEITEINKTETSKNKSDYNNKITKAEISETDKKKIEKSLQNHFLFKNKSQNIISNIIDSLQMQKLQPNTTLFKKGEKGNYFYIIKEGNLELIAEYGKKILNQNETFGELALIANKERTATVKSLNYCILYLINGKKFREIVSKINEDELLERLNFLKAISIFNILNNIYLNSIALGMLKCEFEKGQMILYEGDIGQSIYIIKYGIVKCFKGEKEVRFLGPRDFFGESAVLFNTTRSLSVTVVENSICYQISESLLIDIIGEEFRNIIISYLSKVSLKKSKYMKLLSNEIFFGKILENCNLKTFNNNDIIYDCKKINDYNKFYVIIYGHFINENNGEILASRNQLFGDEYIKTNSYPNFNIISQDECRTIEFNWDEIFPKLNLNIEKKKAFTLFERIEQLKKISLFQETNEKQLFDIYLTMKKEKFKKGEKIFEEGEKGNKLYFVKKGKIKVFKNSKFIREINEGNYFGELALIINEPRSATVIAEIDSSLLTLTKEDFKSFIDNRMYDYLLKKISLMDNFNLTLDHLFYIKTLGKGKFGNVSLVHNKKNLFAIKAVDRKLADKKKRLIKCYIQERNILLTIDHPFIMKLVKTLKTENYIFFLSEYIAGQTFSKYLSKRTQNQIRNIQDTKFYIATLLIIIDYLNSKNICHRDLKSDNMILNELGYLKLIDFGTSIIIKDFTNTITGTPYYIAPEVLLGKGYGFSCDYWSIGIITYEIYFNSFPFGNNANDPIDIYREVINKNLIIKNGDSKVIQLIKCLLKKKVNERICSLEKAKKLILFKDFKWDDLINFKFESQYCPYVKYIKDMNKYNVKYLNYVNNESENWKSENSSFNSDSSSYSSFDDIDIEYDSSWANNF